MTNDDIKTEPDKKIIQFIKKHHILTLATSNENKPYCCTCFYVYLEKENKFLITSDTDTRHIHEVSIQPFVAGAIALETSMIGKIQGIQVTGIIKKLEGKELEKAKTSYISKFPVAALSKLVMWRIEPDFIKFTDNRLGFGKKIIWSKSN
jgi:uncharacterized protein YhbP (UPF0306 family)